MNDSRNFGADFHGEPNSIITLNEKLPQPRVGVATTASVGLGYTDALRADPYAANLVLALPFVSGGLSSGFGDYAPSIKGSGTQKTFTTNGNVSIADTAGYYGSGAYFDGNGDYLRTSTNISDFQFGTGDFTIETWLWKPANGVNNYDGVISLGTNGSATDGWFLEASSTRGYLWYVAGTGTYQIQYNVSPNTSQWNHLAVCRKGNTTTMYLNGVAVGINTNAYTVPSSATTLDIGKYGGGEFWFNGYLQDLRVYKGVAKYTGGFDVPRPYTPVGIATWRQVPDTTANNFATLNPLANGNAVNTVQISYANGNNTATWSATAQNNATFGTVGINSGKWYWEGRLKTVGGSFPFIGISSQVGISTAQSTSNYGQSGTGVYKGSGTLSAGDIVGVAVSFTSAGVGSTVTFYVNGVESISGTGNRSVFNGQTNTWIPGVSGVNGCVWDFNFGQNPTFSGNTTAGTFTDSNGKGLFKYQPPSGFLALCEDNLPTPAISDPGKYFKTVLYAGDTQNGRSIVGVGFTPDLVWIKNRNIGTVNNGDNMLFDSIRGATYYLSSNDTNAEIRNSNGLQAFNFDGFNPGSMTRTNETGSNYVAWCWRAGAGTTSTNTNGSITSVVSVNQDAGFSIATYTGTGSALTFGHGLGKVPAFAIFKYRSGPSGGWAWIVYHKSLPTNYYVYLQSTVAQQNLTGVFTTAPTSTLFSLGTEGAVNTNNNNMVCYSWAEIENFSKFGSYVGNGNADGPFVYCGFKPAFILTKRTDSSSQWRIWDSSRSSVNVSEHSLIANASDSEITGSTYYIDMLSNGFKIRASTNDFNASGGSYIFAAWAESPFQTANSK
jgi:hypothetical protein